MKADSKKGIALLAVTLVVAIALRIVAHKLDSGYLHQVSIVGPATYAGYFVERYFSDKKTRLTPKEWVGFIIVILLLALVFHVLKMYIF